MTCICTTRTVTFLLHCFRCFLWQAFIDKGAAKATVKGKPSGVRKGHLACKGKVGQAWKDEHYQFFTTQIAYSSRLCLAKNALLPLTFRCPIQNEAEDRQQTLTSLYEIEAQVLERECEMFALQGNGLK